MMRKIGILSLALLFGLMVGISSSYATLVKIDLNSVAITGLPGTVDGKTGLFPEMTTYMQTTSLVADLDDDNLPDVNETFTDIGNMHITSLPGTLDNEGINSLPGWELTGRWTDLTGEIVGETTDVNTGRTTYLYDYYTGTLTLYADGTPEQKGFGIGSYGTSFGSQDDTIGDFTGEVQVAQLSLTGGTGNLTFSPGGDPLGGYTDLDWVFNSMAPGFWLDQNNNDLNDFILNIGWYVIAEEDSNTAHVSKNLGGADEFFIYSDHNGSVEINVVPEPATMLLLGSGLIGLAGFGRKKKFFKKG